MPKRPEQNKAIQEKRRQDIKDKALRLFAIQGFDEISVDDICKAAKCAHGLFYHYYASREELFSDLLKDMGDDLLPLTEAKSEPGFSGLRLLLVQITSSLQEKLTNKQSYLLLHLNFHKQRELQKAVYKKHFGLYQIMKEKIKEGQKEGALIAGDPEEILESLAMLLRGQLITKIEAKEKGFKYLSEDVLELMIQKSAQF